MRQHNTLAVSSLNDARTLSSDSNCCYCQLSHSLTDWWYLFSVSIVSRSLYTQPLTYVSPISRNLSLSGSVDRVTDIFFSNRSCSISCWYDVCNYCHRPTGLTTYIHRSQLLYTTSFYPRRRYRSALYLYRVLGLCRSAWVGFSSQSVCLFVRSITRKRMIPKCSNLV